MHKGTEAYYKDQHANVVAPETQLWSLEIAKLVFNH